VKNIVLLLTWNTGDHWVLSYCDSAVFNETRMVCFRKNGRIISFLSAFR